ncbi:MAG: fibro-slime domain-containing protein [Acutalibacteraceae bacterium]
MSKKGYSNVNNCKRIISVFLTLILVFSMCIVGEITVSAASFTAGQYVYLDVQNATNWNSGNAVSTCFMYKYNHDQGDSYVDSIVMEKVRGKEYLYRCFILDNNINYLKFSRGNGKDHWNWAGGNNGYHGRDGSKNCFYVNSGDFNSVSWGELRNGITTDPDNKVQSNATHYNYELDNVTFVNNSSNTISNDNLKLVDATFYDYYSNDEMVHSGYWLDGLDESQRSYKDREPFTFFNYAISKFAQSNSGFSNPLYFGDFMRSADAHTGALRPWYDGYQGAGVSSLYNYRKFYNNSNATGYGTSGSIQGLIDSTMKNGTVAKNGVALPYFDESFLKSNNVIGKPIGSVVDTKFAFRKTKDSKNDTVYEYTSENGKDNYFFSGLKTNNVTANYTYNNNKAVDAASGFGGSKDGYGFFPFDNAKGKSQVNAKNFGFGMKLTIPFSVGSTGKTQNGNPVVFSFTGDDDVWVFVDGNLVLDLGGAHKKASGQIDFTNKKVTYHTGCGTVNGSRGVPNQAISSSALQDFDYGKSHIMTVFYMERGMIESNLAISFNFAPEVELITTKKVDVANVNSGLQNTVSNLDTFTFTNKDETTGTALKEKVYYDVNNNALKSDTNGSYAMKHGYVSTFNNIIDWDSTATQKVGDQISVSEVVPSTTKLQYSTSYTVTNLANSQKITSASGLTSNAYRKAKFVFKDASNGANDYVGYQVDFVNKPNVSDISVTKVAKEEDGTPITDVNFEFSIQLNINGTYKAYPLTYKVGSATKTASNGIFYLKNGEKAVFSGIPLGVGYRIVETTVDGYKVSPASTISGTLLTTRSVTFTNTKKSEVLGELALTAKKTMDGRTPTSGQVFNFTLQELVPTDDNYKSFTDGEYSETKQNSGGDIIFSPIVFTTADLPTEAPTAKPTNPPTNPPTAPPTNPPTNPPTDPPTAKPTDPPSNLIYFKPSNEWKNDNARFAAYFFNGSVAETWISLTYDSSIGYYKGTIPTGGYRSVIFVRMNPSSTANNWTNKWNQTADLTINGNCFVANNGWDGITGTWSTLKAIASSYSNGSSNANISDNAVITKADKVITAESLATTSGYVYKFYKVSEQAGTDTDIKYDKAVYYCKVAINMATEEVETYYYNSLNNMIAGTPTIQPTSIVFKNEHIGSLTISKITKDANNNQKPLTGVKFVLYKLTSKNQIAEKGTIIDRNGNAVTTNISKYQGEQVDANGLLKYTNLAISANPADTSEDNKQWYCVKEFKTVDGYALSTKEHRFYLPQLKVIEDKTEDYDVTIGNVNYQYKYSIAQTFVNSAITAPSSGGQGSGSYIIVGLSLIFTGMAMAFAMQYKKRRKENA